MGRQLAIVVIILTCFILLTTVAMLTTYIAQIRGKISYLVVENLKLLNKMHEGLVVVSETDMSLKFASLPAIRILK